MQVLLAPPRLHAVPVAPPAAGRAREVPGRLTSVCATVLRLNHAAARRYIPGPGVKQDPETALTTGSLSCRL
jgi:hypothetical protein